MTRKEKVELGKDEICSDCKEVIKKGNKALKDRSVKGETRYYHTNHVKT